MDSVKVSLEVATQAADIALKNLKKTTEETNNAFSIFKGSFAAGLAIDALKGAFESVTGFVHSVIEESAKAEQSIQNLNVALKNSGLYSQATSAHFKDLADSIEMTTSFNGQAVESTITLLASLTKLNKDGITQATQASVDLAATLNVDLGTATEMIAKAVNGNVTAFNKLGIKIQDGRTDAERLANTLKALTSQQGAAAKQSDTYTGVVTKLENQKEKLYEAVGNLITQNPLVISGFKALTDVFINLGKYIEENSSEITLIAESLAASIAIVTAASAAWATYTFLASGATLALGALRTAATIAWAAVTGPVGLAIAAIVAVGVVIYEAIKHWDAIKIATFDATAAVLEYAAKTAGIFSADTEKKLKSEAQAFRDKADAVRIAQAAELEAKNAQKQADANKSDADDAKAQALKEQQRLTQLKKFYAEANAAKAEHDQSIILSDQDRDIQLQVQKLQHEQTMFEISGQYDSQALAKQLANDQATLAARQAFEQQQIQALADAERNKALLIEDSQARQKALRDADYKATLAQTQLNNKQLLEQTKLRNSSEEQLARQQMNNKRDTWNTLLTLQNSSNKELAAAGKAFAIYDIAVNTPVAISKALAAYPPPFNFAAAALVAAAMASQAANVAGINFATGGIVPGTSYSGDKVAANVNSREMILNMKQQKRLFDIANGGGNSSSGTNQLLSELITAVKGNMSIQIDGKEIISVVRDGRQSGRTL